MTVAGRNQHHPIYKLVYSSLLIFMPRQEFKIKEQSLCTEHSHVVEVSSHHQTDAKMKTNSSVFTLSCRNYSSDCSFFTWQIPYQLTRFDLRKMTTPNQQKVPLKGVQISGSEATEEKTWLAVSTAWSFLHLSHIKTHSLSSLKKYLSLLKSRSSLSQTFSPQNK